MAGWYLGNDEPREAIPMLQEALVANPENIRLLDALGTAYLRSDQPQQAMDQFEKVLKVQPNNAVLQYRMGQLKASRGDTTAAMAHLRKAIELEPKALEPRVAMAGLLVRAGKSDEARKVAATLQKDNPRSPAGLVLEGDIAMVERKFGDAAGAYRRALSIEKAPAIQIKLAQATVAEGKPAEADAMVRSMAKERPDDVTVRMFAGEYELARKRWPDAIEHYGVALAKQPNNVLAMNNMAWAMYEAKDPKALETAEKAFNIAPTSAAVMDTLGVILVDRGQNVRGVQLLRQAVASAPKAPAIRLHLAEALLKTGDKAGAKTEVEMLLKDAPRGAVAERAMELQKKL